MVGVLYYLKGRLVIEQLPGGLWFAQYTTWSGSAGPRMTGLTALSAANSVREYHELRGTRRLTGRRAHQVADRRPPHHRGYPKRALIKGAGSQK